MQPAQTQAAIFVHPCRNYCIFVEFIGCLVRLFRVVAKIGQTYNLSAKYSFISENLIREV